MRLISLLEDVWDAIRSGKTPEQHRDELIHKLHKQNLTPDQIAKLIGMPLHYVTRALLNPAKEVPREPDLKNKVIELYKQGKSKKHISASLRMPIAQVRFYISQFKEMGGDSSKLF